MLLRYHNSYRKDHCVETFDAKREIIVRDAEISSSGNIKGNNFISICRGHLMT